MDSIDNDVLRSLRNLLNKVSEKQYNSQEDVMEEFLNIGNEKPQRGDEIIECPDCGNIQKPFYFGNKKGRGVIQDCDECGSTISFEIGFCRIMD